MSEPMKPGTTVGGTSGGIVTPMNVTNVQRKNTPAVLTYRGMPSKEGGAGIMGPGVRPGKTMRKG